MRLSTAQLAKRIGADLFGDGDVQIIAVKDIETSGENDVTFIADEKHIDKIEKSRAGAVIVGMRFEGLAKSQLIVKDVNAALIETLNVFAPKLKTPIAGVDPTAKIGQNVEIAEDVSVGAGAVIGDGVVIGKNSVIADGCKIGENSKLGRNCRFDGNVVVYHNCIIGDNVIIQANSTIGSTGFGYSFIDGIHRLVPHNGRVVIEDFVEIGANCCVDRAKFGETRIGAGTKIDNLVQIAHNVIIGKNCLIAGQVGIAGSCKLGDNIMVGGQAGFADNIRVGDGTMIGAGSGVFHNAAAGQQLFGMPATNSRDALKVIALTRRLPKLAEQLKQLSKRIKEVGTAKNDKE